MSALDLVLGALGLISALFALLLLFTWRWIDRADHVLAWAGAYVAATLQWCCLLADHHAGSATPELWVLGNALAICAGSLALAGYRLRAGVPVPTTLLVGGGFLVLAAVLWFSAVSVHAGISNGAVPLYAGLLLLLSTRALSRGGGPALAPQLASRVLLGLCAGIEFVAGVTAIAGGPAGGAAAPAVEAWLHWLMLPAIYAGVGSSMLFLVAMDLSEQMKRLAIADPLTGVMNRRGFLDAALRAISQARRAGTPLTLVMTDLDHFKRINDTYGHAAGDRALKRFALHLQSELRQSDLVGRIDGEEFALLLSNTTLAAGVSVAERLCHALGIAAIEVGPARARITASFGVALLSDSDGDVEDLLERAGRGLYRAKETGRDRVCTAPEEDQGPDLAFA